MQDRRATFFILPVCVGLGLVASAARAQEPGLKLALGDFGIGIGDVPRIDGLRLNYRDRHLERVRGVNVTIWVPYEGSDGLVQGLGLGLPVTGAARMQGLAIAAGVGVEEDFTGVGLTALGMGTGGSMRGMLVAGLGAGAGESVEGLMLAGLGVGAGQDVRGIAIAGLGAGAGGSLTGLGVGGLGIGSGGDVTGAMIGGVGVGAGGRVRGLAIGGIGVGVGGDLTGLAIGGVGVGVGGELKGLGIGGIGVGAARIRGVVITGIAAGGSEVRGFVVAPAYLRIAQDGLLGGVSISAFNDIRGAQHGIVIGLLNITQELHGLQLGLINIARNKERFPVLPFVNYHR